MWNGHGNPDLSTPNYILAWNKEYAWKSSTTSSGGGKGGYCSATSNQDPTLVGPANSAWGAGYRNNQGGFGGRPLDYSTGRIFLGGGGGAGQGNDTYSGAGGNGGGLIYLMCNGSVSGTGELISNGNDGGNAQGTPSITAYTGRDGAGGAGAGGTIILYVTGGSVSGITAIANGGKGGDLVMVKGAFSGGPTEAEGPGGGGSGGYISLSSGAIAQQVNGGNNGLVTGNALSNVLNKFPANGATKGGSGSSGQTITTFNIVARDTAICNSETVALSVSLAGVIPSGVVLTWYDAAVAGNVVSSGTSFTTPVLTATQTYYVAACPGFYRVPIKVSVGDEFSSTLTATDATCSTGGGVTVALTGGTASFIYTWSNGATSAMLTNAPAATYTLTVTDAGGCSTTSTATVNASTAINVNNITSTNLACFGSPTGVVSINPSGGQTPYTYAWSNGTTGTNSITGLSANTYVVTVTDAFGCSAVSSAIITQPSVISTPTFAITPASCGSSNGAATATSSGGTGILTYSWSNGATGQTAASLSATTYTLTVTDNNGCSITNSTTIGNSGGLTTIGSISSSIQCSGGTGAATVSTTGGSGPFTFNWSNGTTATTTSLTHQVLNLTANTYTVTVLDAGGCSSTTTVTLTEPAAASISRLSQNEICGNSNGSITATVTSASGPFTYSWSNGTGSTTTNSQSVLSDLSAAIYSLTVTDASGCTSTTVALINNINTGNMSVAPTQKTIAKGVSVSLAVVGGSIYTWSPVTGLSCTNCSTPTATPDVTTTYTVNTTDVNGCNATFAIVITVNNPCVGNENDVFIPNIFSPNNDGKNDMLFVQGNGLVNIYWAIYNRWGNKIFETLDKNTGWDGTFRGQAVDDGVYVYYLKATCVISGEEVTIKGNVTLLR